MNINPQFRPDSTEEPTAKSLFETLGIPQVHPLQIPVLSKGDEKFPLGVVVATPAAREKICPRCVGLALHAHAHGAWGPHLSKWDCLANDDALKNGGRLLSKYRGNEGVFFYILTDEERALTTVCLADEF